MSNYSSGAPGQVRPGFDLEEWIAEQRIAAERGTPRALSEDRVAAIGGLPDWSIGPFSAQRWVLIIESRRFVGRPANVVTVKEIVGSAGSPREAVQWLRDILAELATRNPKQSADGSSPITSTPSPSAQTPYEMAALLVAALTHGRTGDADTLISAIIKPGPEHYATAVNALTEWTTASSGRLSIDSGR